MPRQIILKRLVSFLGFGLTLASLIFLGQMLYQQFGNILDLQWDLADLLALMSATALSAASLLILAFSWALMLQKDTEIGHRLLLSILVYTNTSIFKYLPGNIFHFVGRNVMGHKSGKEHRHLAAATFFEVGFSLLSAALLSALVFSFAPAPLSQGLFRFIAFSLIVATAAIIYYPQLIKRIVGLLPSSFFLAWFPQNIAGAMISNMIAFSGIMSAAALLGLTVLEEGIDPVSAAALFIFAWLVGFVVPGAPGGIGVREAFLVMELAPLTGETSALTFALMMRLATMGGDLALYFGGIAIGLILKKRAT